MDPTRDLQISSLRLSQLSYPHFLLNILCKINLKHGPTNQIKSLTWKGNEPTYLQAIGGGFRRLSNI